MHFTFKDVTLFTTKSKRNRIKFLFHEYNKMVSVLSNTQNDPKNVREYFYIMKTKLDEEIVLVFFFFFLKRGLFRIEKLLTNQNF